ncbi:hypothetical protein SAMN05216203_0953 [Marinobacter daqiaonensis]|uniref:Protein FliT n=1 Tax=Marinobacter daqiaonensis TaxID=650891 RepID=A0A1I6H775_9GAMM|nr:SOS cell division inhibitor [Marinobacter daqiaonensis]SFR50260.1 hypothetical protein SAMN05216203_0953 [Marinobacter daqiaonensis]
MNDANQDLERLDQRILQLQQALEAKDWSLIAELNRTVSGLISPVMDALEKGELSPTAVQQRLQTMQSFVTDADRQARNAREEAREALAQVGQNRKAASAYEGVSSRRK